MSKYFIKIEYEEEIEADTEEEAREKFWEKVGNTKRDLENHIAKNFRIEGEDSYSVSLPIYVDKNSLDLYGYDTSDVDSEALRDVARTIADLFLDYHYPNELETACDKLNVPQKQ